MDWTAIGTVTAALAVIGAFFLWVVQAIVKNSITEAINGFETRIAVLEQRSENARKAVLARWAKAKKAMI